MRLTVEQMMVEVWESLGEPGTLDIYDGDGNVSVSTEGGAKVLRAINSGQLAVCAWRDDAKRRSFRFKTFYQEQYLSVTVGGGAAGSGNTTSVLQLAAGDQGQNDNYYQGWVVEVGSEGRLVVASDSTSVTVGRPFGAAPATGATYTLTKRWMTVDLSGGVEDVIGLVDVTSDLVLDEGQAHDFFEGRREEVGDPGSWYRSGNRLYLDVAPDTDRYFMAQLYRLPTTLSALADESELPPQFHRGIVLWALGYWGFAREMEPAMAYSFQRKFTDFMKETMTEYEMVGWREAGPEIAVEVV